MNKYFNYYNSLCTGANTPVIFTSDPYITAVKTMLVQEIKQIVYYIEKLKSFNEDMNLYRDKVIEFISILLFNSDFKRESVYTIISDLYQNKMNLKLKYTEKAKAENKEPELYPSDEPDLSVKEKVLKLLNAREQNTTDDTKNLTEKRKILYSIIMNIVLNTCNCLLELKNYGTDMPEAKDEVLALINSANYPDNKDEDIKNKIKDFSEMNRTVMKKLYSAVIERFGPIIKNEVPFSVKEGKAVLVSGTSLIDLENILKEAEKTGVNVYTHHKTFRAYKYKKFKNYKYLAGHYQVYGNNFREEFAAFPGAVYISVNSIPKMDVIRGQIYTGAKYPEYGTGKIENGDFSVLTNVALKSKGFSENINKKKINTGYDIEDITSEINKIIKLYKENEIKHIIIAGKNDIFSENNEYLSILGEKYPENCFLISFGCKKGGKNFFYAAESFDYSLLYTILEKFEETDKKILNSTTVIITDCNSNTISHLFNISNLNVKNIMSGPCCPNVINPSIIKGLNEEFGFRQITTPEEDLKYILTE